MNGKIFVDGLWMWLTCTPFRSDVFLAVFIGFEI